MRWTREVGDLLGISSPAKLALYVGGTVVSSVVGTAVLNVIHQTPTWLLLVFFVALMIMAWGALIMRAERRVPSGLRALATELNDFFMERRAGSGQVSKDQANRYETETRRIYEQRNEARAFQMCERLHTRGWITDPQWENLRGFDLRATLPGERIVDVARRFGVI